MIVFQYSRPWLEAKGILVSTLWSIARGDIYIGFSDWCTGRVVGQMSRGRFPAGGGFLAGSMGGFAGVGSNGGIEFATNICKICGNSFLANWFQRNLIFGFCFHFFFPFPNSQAYFLVGSSNFIVSIIDHLWLQIMKIVLSYGFLKTWSDFCVLGCYSSADSFLVDNF